MPPSDSILPSAFAVGMPRKVAKKKGVSLEGELKDLAELLAENTHEHWSQQRISQAITVIVVAYIVMAHIVVALSLWLT